MDRSWMYIDILDEKYQHGIRDFCKTAVENLLPKDAGYIKCPCRDCGNVKKYQRIEEIKYHLSTRGFTQNYTVWQWHGEDPNDVPKYRGSDSRHDSEVNDANMNDNCDFEVCDLDEENNSDDDSSEDDQIDAMLEDVEEHFSGKPNAHKNLIDASKIPLYPGCPPQRNKLAFVLKLLNVKASNGWSDKSFTTLLEILHDDLPDQNEVPTSTYEAKKLLRPLGMEYKKIHACPKDCILYWKKYEHHTSCPFCGLSRYKLKEKNGVSKHGPPAKVLWYLPIIPRFKRLFAVEKDAKNLTWHATDRIKDGKLRHPADSPQWRNIDKMFPEFGNETRNLRLGLCTDGMNPYGTLSSIHSTWPVLLVIYNLPSWLCMKRKHIMLSLLISGPKQPGNDIDVYLQPLIDDLKLLWGEGTIVYDSFAKEEFTMRAMLFCTINDFPAYGNLSGYSIKGSKACPICEDETIDIRLKHSGKNVYMGHRSFLPKGHPYRAKKKRFNGKTEHRVARLPLSAEEVYKKVMGIKNHYGKSFKRVGKSSKHVGKCIWKKKSIFWDLPYWRKLPVRHCLDLMHIEKNVAESLVGTLLNIPGKTKDGLKARKDLVELGIRLELAPQESDEPTFLPPACFTLSKEEKISFCNCLHNTKVPSGYASNIKNLVSMSDLKLVGLKSHDYHVLMQHLLPVAIRDILPKNVRNTITKLCLFFKSVCGKVLDVDNLEQLQADIVVTLCELEMYFLPSFFDIMVHLIVHVVREIKHCGPVYLRYMYPFERYMGVLKGRMKNRSRPEGSIIEGTIVEEATEFCSSYLSRAESIGLPKSRHEGRLEVGVGVVGKKVHRAETKMHEKAHLLVLQHIPEVEPYFEDHMNILRVANPSKSDLWLTKEQNKSFIDWFKKRVLSDTSNSVTEHVKWLAYGPKLDVVTYEGYDINGFTYYTKRQDLKSTRQNSGVSIEASSTLYVNAEDTTPLSTKKTYYGIIDDIWVLDYVKFDFCLFRCKWVNNRKGCHEDDFGFTLVDLSRATYGDEPFVLASQVKQVFYMNDPVDSKLSVVRKGKRCIVGLEDVNDEED